MPIAYHIQKLLQNRTDHLRRELDISGPIGLPYFLQRLDRPTLLAMHYRRKFLMYCMLCTKKYQ